MYTMVEEWYSDNFALVASSLPYCAIDCDWTEGTWIHISGFPLPANFRQETTNLLMVFAGTNHPITSEPRGFYLDQGLITINGNTPDHVFNTTSYHGFMNLSDMGYAWFCLLIDHWNPSQDVASGDNMISLINSIYAHLKTLS